MALIPCPNCGRDVSDAAPTCSACGGPVAMQGAAQRAAQAPRSRRLGFLVAACLGAALGAGVGILLALATTGSAPFGTSSGSSAGATAAADAPEAAASVAGATARNRSNFFGTWQGDDSKPGWTGTLVVAAFQDRVAVEVRTAIGSNSCDFQGIGTIEDGVVSATEPRAQCQIEIAFSGDEARLLTWRSCEDRCSANALASALSS